jgi:hypothetical protein
MVDFSGLGLLAPRPESQLGRPQTTLLLVPTLLTCRTWVALPETYAPVSIAFRIIGARKPPLNDKTEVLEGGKLKYIELQLCL